MRLVYTLLVQLLRPIALGLVLWRSRTNADYRAGFAERFGRGARVDEARSLWIHAVSLGEVVAAAPLVRALRLRHPDTALILTTATPTGRARALELFDGSVSVRYVPYDTPGSMRRFLALVHPQLVVIMETELWPNLFRECRRRGVPVLLANARLSSKSVARYRRCGRLFRDVFAGDTVVAAQSTDDAERFIAIGAAPERTLVMGNLKFDIAADAAVSERGRHSRATHWPGRPVWIAGSTHDGEEEAALTAHLKVQAQVPTALLLLVPRHPERFQSVADLLNRRGFRFEWRSSGNSVRSDAQVLLVDTVGELGGLYAAADVAFVGGSLVPVGGHNLLEPAALGLPVITGPHQANAREIVEKLVRERAAVQVADADALAHEVTRLLSDDGTRQAAGAGALRVVAENRGSLARLLKVIAPLLAAAGPSTGR